MSLERYISLLALEEYRFRNAESLRLKGLSEAEIDARVASRLRLAERKSRLKTRQQREYKQDMLDIMGKPRNRLEEEL